MSKYPELHRDEINAIIERIKNKTFNTYEFISEWEKLYPNSKNVFSGIGEGWRKVIGRKLSLYAQTQKTIKSLNKKYQGAELWVKN